MEGAGPPAGTPGADLDPPGQLSLSRCLAAAVRRGAERSPEPSEREGSGLGDSRDGAGWPRPLRSGVRPSSSWLWLQASAVEHAFPCRLGDLQPSRQPPAGSQQLLLQTLTDPGEAAAEQGDTSCTMDPLPETLSEGLGRAGCLWA